MLAQLGALARQRGAQWVDVPFARLPRNQPALDFLESVGAPFKQPNQFHFPADSAAKIEFNPHRDATSPPGKSEGDNSRPMGASRKFTQCRTIALESRDASKIHARIEARLA